MAGEGRPGSPAGRSGEIRPAVQPGGQIAALKGDTGLGQAVGFMTHGTGERGALNRGDRAELRTG